VGRRNAALARGACRVGCVNAPGTWRLRTVHECTLHFLERCVDYIHYNPVKHRLAQRAKEWSYSTFHRYVSRGGAPGELERRSEKRRWWGRGMSPRARCAPYACYGLILPQSVWIVRLTPTYALVKINSHNHVKNNTTNRKKSAGKVLDGFVTGRIY
jgi:hypothetical protein